MILGDSMVAAARRISIIVYCYRDGVCLDTELLLLTRIMVVLSFSLLARIWGECSTIHFPPALFFLKVEISLCILIPLFMPGSIHSGLAS